MGLKEDALKLHEDNKGKLAVSSKVEVKDKNDLSLVYTPGVAEVCKVIAENPEEAYKYTFKSNTVAVFTDGSAVLGLGNIGAKASLPVMEGKSILFKQLADIDAFPICVDTQDKEELIKIARNIAPGFGGINLEDISAPKCFEIEKDLQDLGIPVMHDDQHGTAITVLAAMINAAKVVDKKMEDLKVVVNGAGAAGIATVKLLNCFNIDKKICMPVRDIIVCDSKGIIHRGREGLNDVKEQLAGMTNRNDVSGILKDALKDADVFIGLSKGNVLTAEDIKVMGKDAIILAMANPIPEIMPSEALKVAKVVGTGRSDFPNQINNSLAFPGVFRGALDARALRINDEMKIAAAKAIAGCVEPTVDNILPYTLDKNVVPAVAKEVARIAKETGACEK
ncbi:NADP-dependent malic enzyme [Candidatus Woesearchaeota archaeon]|nr:NADP-dependent malic enzyme [Candidatus Woesearchaeota archaeon]